MLILLCTSEELHTQVQIHSKGNHKEFKMLLLIYKAHYNFEHYISPMWSQHIDAKWVCTILTLPQYSQYTWKGRCSCWQCWGCLKAIQHLERISIQFSYDKHTMAIWILSSYEKEANIWITNCNGFTNKEHYQGRTIHLDPHIKVTVLCVHSILTCIVLKVQQKSFSGSRLPSLLTWTSIHSRIFTREHFFNHKMSLQTQQPFWSFQGKPPK